MINKDDLRNSKEPYRLPLDWKGMLYKIDLKFNIDNETRTFKRWHLSELKLLSKEHRKVQYRNSNGNIYFTLSIELDNNGLLVSCDCDRKVDMLCHHAYTGLKQLITQTSGHVYEIFLRDELDLIG